MKNRHLILFAALSLASPLFTACTVTSAHTASPSDKPASVQIEGPVSGGTRGVPYASSIVDLAPYGYQEAEYFVSGTAHTFQANAPLTSAGQWAITPATPQAYKTRILVRRPTAAKFNGTVIVEFMQEYFGTERDTNYHWNAETFLSRGYGWVGLSLHHEGIDDPTPPRTMTYNGQSFTMGQNLSQWDKERYASLSVPTSDLSYAILSDVGRALKTQTWAGGTDPFSGLKIDHLLAVGNTIAAKRLGIYINAVHPMDQIFDGFYLQDFVPNAEAKLAKDVDTPAAWPRADNKTPVLVFQTMTAAAESGRQAETDRLRIWAPSGTSHTNEMFMARVQKANARDLGMSGGLCPAGFANILPQQYLSGAAIVALDTWVKSGKPPKSHPQPAKFEGPREPITEPKSYFDSHGNVAGGLRSPWVEVPIARYDWRGPCTGGSGRTFTFNPAELTALYGTPENYHRLFEASAMQAEADGILLPADAQAAIKAARQFHW